MCVGNFESFKDVCCNSKAIVSCRPVIYGVVMMMCLNSHILLQLPGKLLRFLELERRISEAFAQLSKSNTFNETDLALGAANARDVCNCLLILKTGK